MVRSRFLLSVALVMASLVGGVSAAAAQTRGAPARPLDVCTPAEFAGKIRTLADPNYDPGPLTAPPVLGPPVDPGSEYVRSLVRAFVWAPIDFKQHLCGLDAVI